MSTLLRYGKIKRKNKHMEDQKPQETRALELDPEHFDAQKRQQRLEKM